MKNTQPKLYHYTSLSVALEKILPDMQLRMGYYSKTNDPRENKGPDLLASLTGGGSRDEFFASAGKGWGMASRLHSRLQLLCFSEDAEGARYPEQRGYGLSRLWAQYGGAHTGVCLAFDRDLLGQAVKKAVKSADRLWSQAVDYQLLAWRSESPYTLDLSSIPPSDVGGMVLAHFKQHHKELMFVKAEDWRSEREYRWVYLAEKGEDEIYVPIHDCLDEVIVGVEFHTAYTASLRSVCRGKPIRMMEWSCGSWVEPADLGT